MRDSGFLGEVAQGRHVSVVVHAGHDGGGYAGDERLVSEILPGVDVGEVYFYGL